ncbi:MAG TPA: response regulator [Pedobacter sp.]|jgi:DNA-binding response OmpR family regulator
MSKKILVIDDDADILEFITITLDWEGFEVIPRTGFPVLSELEAIKPNLILMDNWLNGTRGSDLCKTIKENEGLRHIPVILLSAVNDLEKLAHECGANAYLAKPFDLIELETLVQQFT